LAGGDACRRTHHLAITATRAFGQWGLLRRDSVPIVITQVAVSLPRLRTLVRRGVQRFRRRMGTDPYLLSFLTLAALVVGLFAFAFEWVPDAMLVLVILGGGFVLRIKSLLVLYGVVGAIYVYLNVKRMAFDPGSLVLVAATAAILLAMARIRSRLGVQGTRGESMLVDLRGRLAAQGELPVLPPTWRTDRVLRSAGGASFSGDFIVANKSGDDRWLEVVLVDVSGKGMDAGTRALLLSGAFGGLLGSLSRKEFLPAANQYLLRQEWEEGFATAVHLAVDLVTGDYEVSSAGHPPAAQFVARSGRWEITTAEGPLLGVIDAAEYVPYTGRLEAGDALLLYTDGVIEGPTLDIDVGIDRLLGEAERLVTRGFGQGAGKLVSAVGDAETDDRALFIIWRG
jgi:hypothetical protein